MIKNKQKIIHILGELLNFGLRNQPQKVTITIEELEDRVEIALASPDIQASPQECREMERLLNMPLRDELRDYYSGLAGEEALALHNLRMVGMMVDGGRLEHCAEGGRLVIWWKL